MYSNHSVSSNYQRRSSSQPWVDGIMEWFAYPNYLSSRIVCWKRSFTHANEVIMLLPANLTWGLFSLECCCRVREDVQSNPPDMPSPGRADPSRPSVPAPRTRRARPALSLPRLRRLCNDVAHFYKISVLRLNCSIISDITKKTNTLARLT